MIAGIFPEMLSPGGIQRVGIHTAAVLASYATHHGIAYQFISLNDPPGMHHIHVHEQVVPVVGCGRNKPRFLVSVLRLALRRPGVLLAAHPNLAPLVWLMKLITPHMRWMTLTYGIEVAAPLPLLRRSALGQSDLVLAISTDTLQKVQIIQGVSADRSTCLPLPLDPDFAHAAQSIDTQSLPPEFPAGQVILTVGRMASDEQYKGMDTLIEALAQLIPQVPNARLVLVGDGNDRPRLEHLAGDRGVSERVHFLGRLPQDALMACYQHCDVFALPSRGEGFGLVFLEAMALGKPVIGGAHGGTLDIIEDSVTGFLVSHGDVSRLVAVLARLLTEQQLSATIGQRARAHVQNTYLFSHFQQRFVRYLETLYHP